MRHISHACFPRLFPTPPMRQPSAIAKKKAPSHIFPLDLCARFEYIKKTGAMMHRTNGETKMIDYNAAAEKALANCDAASAAFIAAQRAFDRSRSAKNRAALIAASQAFEIAAEASRNAQNRAERAETVARRMAAIAPRRAIRAAQMDMFA